MRNPVRALTAAVLAFATAGCGGAAGGDGESLPESASRVASASSGRSGTFEIGDTSYQFRITSCDLSAERTDGVVLRGAGTAPDGRSLSVVVQRTATSSGNVVWESATLYFGSIVDGDHWTARRGGRKDGLWMPGRPGEAADGPLIEVSGNELLVQATLSHETDDSSRPGVLRATCS